jgi:predicted ester cyclase
MTATPAEVARKVFEAFNDNGFDDFRAILAPELTLNGMEITADQWVAGVKGMKKGDPENRIEVTETIVEGNRVAALLHSTGRHSWPWLGSEPTNKIYESKGVYVFTVVDGVITEAWDVWDMLGQMIQLGMWPPPGQKS